MIFIYRHIKLSMIQAMDKLTMIFAKKKTKILTTNDLVQRVGIK